ncbi:HNH endonuclease [Corynebacterium glyciniphilum]|uniref:HNH endonuclease n=1 Tax=Corynebacterium glyciniphilum TaxID=1404244 RepID=UPI0026564CBF|nr:HNH endonuclease [Corynebacterium glyciniphilum]MDN6706388.1 HNH endonuclease [Corynebacterium glyciniphilum]
MPKPKHYRTSDPAYLRKRKACLAPDPLYCALCGERIDKTLKWPDPGCATADHIDAVSRGGHNLGPLQPAHKLCNEQKGPRARSGDRRRSEDAHVLPW